MQPGFKANDRGKKEFDKALSEVNREESGKDAITRASGKTGKVSIDHPDNPGRRRALKLLVAGAVGVGMAVAGAEYFIPRLASGTVPHQSSSTTTTEQTSRSSTSTTPTSTTTSSTATAENNAVLFNNPAGYGVKEVQSGSVTPDTMLQKFYDSNKSTFAGNNMLGFIYLPQPSASAGNTDGMVVYPQPDAATLQAITATLNDSSLQGLNGSGSKAVPAMVVDATQNGGTGFYILYTKAFFMTPATIQMIPVQTNQDFDMQTYDCMKYGSDLYVDKNMTSAIQTVNGSGYMSNTANMAYNYESLAAIDAEFSALAYLFKSASSGINVDNFSWSAVINIVSDYNKRLQNLQALIANTSGQTLAAEEVAYDRVKGMAVTIPSGNTEVVVSYGGKTLTVGADQSMSVS